MTHPTHPHLLFVYGTLKSAHGNNPLLLRHRSIMVGPAYTADKHLLNDGFPYVFPWSNGIDNIKMYGHAAEQFRAHVRGELWRVTDAGLAACDALEGHPRAYTRTPLKVYCKHLLHDAEIYFMVRGRSWGTRDFQRPDEQGFVEWGRESPAEARDFQRESARRRRDSL